MNNKNIKNKLMNIKKEWDQIKMGKVPKEDIGEEIFTELDLTGSYIYSMLIYLEKYNEIRWDNKTLDNSISNLDRLTKKLGMKKLKLNYNLFKGYELLIRSISLMKKLNEKGDKK